MRVEMLERKIMEHMQKVEKYREIYRKEKKEENI